MFNFAIQELKNINGQIEIEPKSNDFRKKKYILVNSDGQVWTPMYSDSREFIEEDEGTGKIIFGNVRKTEKLWIALDKYLSIIESL